MPAARPIRPPRRCGCRCCRTRLRLPRREPRLRRRRGQPQTATAPPGTGRPQPHCQPGRGRPHQHRPPRRAGDRQRRLCHVRALPNPPNDARSIAKSLRDIGFAVSEGIDLDRAAMQKMTREFLREAARAQVAVVYYAGHGVQIDGRNYSSRSMCGCRPAAASHRRDGRHGYDPGRPRRSGPHQHPDLGCLPQQSDGAASRLRRHRPRHRSRIGTGRADRRLAPARRSARVR